jgi:hypothetical protein
MTKTQQRMIDKSMPVVVRYQEHINKQISEMDFNMEDDVLFLNVLDDDHVAIAKVGSDHEICKIFESHSSLQRERTRRGLDQVVYVLAYKGTGIVVGRFQIM